MNKIEILDKLKNIKLDKDKVIIINGASLVVQDLLEDTLDIDFSCSKDYYDMVNWSYDPAYGNKLKVFECFSLSPTFYDEDSVIEIGDYKFMTVEKIYDVKKSLNRKKDKKILNKLDLYLCSKDNYRYERKLREKGITLIGGVDEVGRGPLVGPVVAACVILPDEFSLEGLTDSKKLSEKKREEFYDKIMEQALSVGVGIVSEKVIDEINIYEATKIAMKEAINKLSVKPEHILIDAMPLDINIPTTSIIKGDLKSITISAASVIAKVTRDRMLIELDKKYPMYDFKNNKGYGTKKQVEAIFKYGIIDEHRKSYEPVVTYLKEKNKLENKEN